AYDSTFAHLVSAAGVDVILVGDSLGMVLQGHNSTVPVTLEHMAYHTEGVARGNQGSLIMADLPFMTAATTERALEAGHTLMAAGSNLVIVEGDAWLADIVTQYNPNGIPVCVHIGHTPHSVNTYCSYRVHGREGDDAQRLVDEAQTLVAAGAESI